MIPWYGYTVCRGVLNTRAIPVPVVPVTNPNYYLATGGSGIMFDMYEVVDIITPYDAAGYFAHAVVLLLYTRMDAY